MDDEGPAPLNYDPISRPRRQDCEEYVEENGSIYIFRPSILRTHGSRLGGKIAVSQMDPLFAVQVDEPKDLDRVERLIEHLGKEAAPSNERLSQ
jgi:N-acylneuraminate cytidylyltransferase